MGSISYCCYIYHDRFVSIQLISPASGEMLNLQTLLNPSTEEVSIQLISPASGELYGHALQGYGYP